MTLDLLPDFLRENYEIHEWKHACAVLKNDFPVEWDNIVTVLTNFHLQRSQIEVGGKNKSLVADALDTAFNCARMGREEL